MNFEVLMVTGPVGSCDVSWHFPGVEQLEISLLHDAAQKFDPGRDNFGNLQRTAQTAQRSETDGLL